MFDLLQDKLIPVRTWSQNFMDRTLPEVFTLLNQGDVMRFPRLREHQVQGWRNLLVQLAALAMGESGFQLHEMTTERWGDALRSMTGGNGPWHLVQEDLTDPAFLQPPHPFETDINYTDRPVDEERDEKADYYRQSYHRPDELTCLYPNKAHSLKPSRIEDVIAL